MKFEILILIILSILSTNTYAQGTFNGSFAFTTNQTGSFPPGSILSYPAGARVMYPGGISISIIDPIYIEFPEPTTIYFASGPTVFTIPSVVVLFGNTLGRNLMSLGPEVVTRFPSGGSVSHGTLNGNTDSTIRFLDQMTLVSYSNCSTIPGYFPPMVSSTNYYNPGVNRTGGMTRFGRSAPQVGSMYFHSNADLTLSSITCSGYTERGWPIRTIRNLQSGSLSISTQTSNVTYLVSSGTSQFSVHNDRGYFIQ